MQQPLQKIPGFMSESYEVKVNPYARLFPMCSMFQFAINFQDGMP